LTGDYAANSPNDAIIFAAEMLDVTDERDADAAEGGYV
jgi:hypothetical protein